MTLVFSHQSNALAILFLLEVVNLFSIFDVVVSNLGAPLGPSLAFFPRDFYREFSFLG